MKFGRMGGMRRFGLRWAVLCLVAAATLHGRGQALAQDDEIPTIAGGQMVRGTVTATTNNHLSIKTDKGEVYQIAVTDNTRMTKGERQPVKMAAIHTGDSVGAMGLLDPPTKTVHAVFLMVMDAEQAKKARESLGKIYIAGRVTAIDELKLTIRRPDGVSQVIAVDEGTSFRKGGRQLQSVIDGSGPTEGLSVSAGDTGGESVTLADIKVGDSVAGKGELKKGTFVPSQLSIADASTRQRRRRPDGVAAGGAEPQ
jgi:hypothetical protein